MDKAFQIVVLGCTGGPRENNVSGYLCSPLHHSEWIALDAGSLLGGIDRALEKNNLDSVSFTDPDLEPAGEMLIKHLRCFLISHAHLDHIAGLVLNSQVDEHKYILGIDSTIDNLRDHIFNGQIWPNYGSEGKEPVLHHYDYLRLSLQQPIQIPHTSWSVEAYPLNHPGRYFSTAFLIENNGKYLLYFGDTSSDIFENEKRLELIWKRIAPLLKSKIIHGIFLECSFTQEEADQVRFGHLDTRLVMQELHHLADLASSSLENFSVIVTHRKESLKKNIDSKKQIQAELSSLNKLGVNFIFPSQGDRILL